MEPTQFDFIFGFYVKLSNYQVYIRRFYFSAIVFDQWCFFYQNFELQGSFRKFARSKFLHKN
jgi:hypothetical protein